MSSKRRVLLPLLGLRMFAALGDVFLAREQAVFVRVPQLKASACGCGVGLMRRAILACDLAFLLGVGLVELRAALFGVFEVQKSGRARLLDRSLWLAVGESGAGEAHATDDDGLCCR